ncbi:MULTISPECIES: hypothetical protein [Okeania]|uniref:hypothetical protein n=1 Tax=Okeania TaxID=1458928 RepID=UPI000F53590D|nr:MULTISPECIES: hypothetical protein [Okeania]NET17158.1 hypothetical protein [Okeania sp. SIO1H6]NET18305.1 hypothetical protein [Okeania sp. SIO1H5]NET75173.1 hypothetical protein [Okeania sp. SIO1F9]
MGASSSHSKFSLSPPTITRAGLPKMALVKRVYDINLNYLGVNPPLAPPPPRRGTGVRSQEVRNKKKEE